MFVLKKLWQATQYSLNGLKAAYKYQWPIRAELFVLIFAIPSAFFIGATALERIILISSVLLVIITELLNSAVETVVDRVSMEKHELSGRAKDIGSAAVLVAVINATIVWLAIVFVNFF